MTIRMTLHAKERALERGIDIDTILAVAKMGKEIHRDEQATVIQFRRHCIVLNTATAEVVTVYRTESHKRRAKKKRQNNRRLELINKHIRKM